MAIDLGIDTVIIPDDGLDSIVTDISKGFTGPCNAVWDPKMPGISSMVKMSIRGVEKSLITSFEPIAVIVSGASDGLTAITDAITKLVSSMPDLIDPKEIINFFILEILNPMIKELMVPIPAIQDIIELLIGTKIMSDFNWKDKLKNGEMIIPPKVQKAIDDGQKWVEDLMTNIENVIKTVVEIVLIPIKFAIGILDAVVKKLKDFLDISKATDTISKMAEYAKDPVSLITGLIADVVGEVMGAVSMSFIPDGLDTSKLVTNVKKLFTDVFSGIKIDKKYLDKLNDPAISQVSCFLLLFAEIFLWVIAADGLLAPKNALAIIGIS